MAKKAECLYVNIEHLIGRVGIERVGFVTLTFADHVTDRAEASRRFNSLSTNFLRPYGMEFVTVPERQSSGRFHFHLVASFREDIRTGFDFAACRAANAAKNDENRSEFKRNEALYFESANDALRQVWRDLRDAAKRYQFGRCETLPILSNSAALARYVGAYVTTAGNARLTCDAGMRSVRYSLTQRAASVQFSWADGASAVWRTGLRLLGMILEMDYEQIQKNFGKKWAWRLKEVITTLGHKEDEALEFIGKIPGYADIGSRLKFVSALCCKIGGLNSFPDIAAFCSFGDSNPENPF